ncbi:MAG TPA: FtsX-like permease family protein, partial [Vicinamibacterales bacterium]
AEWRATSRTLVEIGFYGPSSMSLTDVPVPLRLNGARIAVPLFRALGVPALKGRTFVDEDELPGNEHVIVLAHATWLSRFAGATDVVGRTIILNGQPYKVIGIMPFGFGFPSLARPGMSMNADGELSDAPEFWTPMLKRPRPSGPATGGMTLVPTFALLRAGVSAAQAEAEANTLMPARLGQRLAIEIVAAGVERTRAVRRVLLVFQTAVLFVLFIACANVMNLLLARAAARRRELAVRLAIGASHAQVIRYAVAESMIIGVVGGAAGAALAWVAVAAIRMLPPYVLPRLSDIRVDGVALSIAAGTALGAGALIGLWSSVRLLTSERAGVSIWQREQGLERRQVSRLLVVAETAAGVVLLGGAVLLLGSFLRLTHVDRGIDPADVLSFAVSLPPRLQSPDAQFAFHERFTSELKSFPGVTSVGALEIALSGASVGFDLTIAGHTTHEPVYFQKIAPGVFETLRVQLRGRDLAPSDRMRIASAVVVNESFVRRYLPRADPLGQTLDFQEWRALSIVGVAHDIRPAELTGPVPPTIYIPAESSGPFPIPTYVVRTAGQVPGLLPAVRAAARRVDKDAVVFDGAPLETLLARQVATPEFYGITATAFAAIALVLAALGLYSVLSYSVTARTRELGIRMALGATPRRVVADVVRHAAATVFLGITIGLIGAFWSAQFLESLLFGIRPNDPILLASIAAVFLGVGALAAYVPARRATRVDPITALRAE